MPSSNKLLDDLGYSVLGCTDGVYRLMAKDGVQQFVALLFAGAPVTPATTEVTLMLFPIPAGAPTAATVVEHWRNLDARRLEGQDVARVRLSVPAGLVAEPTEELSFVRPDGRGLRYAHRLRNGDVVCLN